MTGSQREAIDTMKMMESVTVNADLVAQALGMNAGVLRKHVRDGEYHISKYEIFGDRIRFFRRDFLQKIGEMPADADEPTDHQLLVKVTEGLQLLCTSLIRLGDSVQLLLKMMDCMMTTEQRMLYCIKYGDNEETASAANTDG